MTNETNGNVTLENMIETEIELANPPTDGSVSLLADPDPEDTVEAYISTYEIGRGWDMEAKLEYSLRDIEDAVETLQTGKADVSHTHDGYASSTDLETLSDVVDTKADANHTHSEYASVNHSHDGYATQTALDTLGNEVDGKADSTHSHSEYALSSHEHDYASSNHNHDSDYAPLSHFHSDYVTTTDFDALETVVNGKANESHTHSNYAEVSHNHDDYASSTHTHTASEIGAAVSGHNHDSDYASIDHNHDTSYATVGHDHDEDYSAIDHVHSDYATVTSLNEVSTIVSGKANASHSHNDTYYTETEIDTKLSGKSDTSHTHTGVYDASGSATSALASAKEYTDSKIDALVGEGASTTLDTIGEISSAIEDNQDAIDLLNSAIANKANASDLNSHASDTEIHVTEAERIVWNAKSDFSGNYNDLTNKPTIPSISGLATETYVNTQIDAIVIPDSLSDLTADSTHRTVTDAEKSAWNAKSNFSGSYNDLTNKPTIPSIAGLATETYVDEAVSVKADSGHNHNDIYYTETEVDSLLSAKASSNHNHNSSYDALGAANTALTSAKEYTDDAIADEVVARDSAIATAKSSAISTASSDATTKANNALASAKVYADNAVATAKNDLLNGAGSAYDTLKELGDLIDENIDAIEALETVAAGKANASHTHAISDVTNLQSALDGKAATSHGTHVTYSTTAPVMDGTASVGSATTVARSDHKHPTDTSRAAKTDLDTHTSNKSNPHSVTLAQLGVNATANEINVLDGITATVTELNYVDGVTSNIQTQLNGKLSTTGKAASATTADSATNVAWSGVTSKPSYYDAKAIKTITRNGTTFTYTCMDGTTGTFTQQDNNTTYSVATSSANGLMPSTDKSKLDGMVLATVSEVKTYLGI